MLEIGGATSIFIRGYGVKVTIFLIYCYKSVKMSRYPLIRVDVATSMFNIFESEKCFFKAFRLLCKRI